MAIEDPPAPTLPDPATTAALFSPPNRITNRYPFEVSDGEPAENDYYILKVARVAGEKVPTVTPNRRDGVPRPNVDAWAQAVAALVV